jgi:hypothetical protein
MTILFMIFFIGLTLSALQVRVPDRRKGEIFSSSVGAVALRHIRPQVELALSTCGLTRWPGINSGADGSPPAGQ